MVLNEVHYSASVLEHRGGVFKTYKDLGAHKFVKISFRYLSMCNNLIKYIHNNLHFKLVNPIFEDDCDYFAVEIGKSCHN
jgi:hypothetical protein